MLAQGMLVRPTHDAIIQCVFGFEYRQSPFNPGSGTVISTRAPMPGCVIVRFPSGERMTHADWLEPA